MQTRITRVLVAALVAVGIVGGTAMASPTINEGERGIVGIGHGADALALTIAAADSELAYVSICGEESWCTMSGSLWSTVELKLACSVVDGTTWYGGAWAVLDRATWAWWTFKVVDGGLGVPDEMGMHRPSSLDWSTSRSDGACGARRLTTSPVVAGDFRLVRPPG